MPDSPSGAFSVLIVDDISKNIQILGNILRAEGYVLAFAVSGEQALEMMGADRYDLVLLDVMMPGLDGFEVCRRLKTSTESRDIPIIFLTAKTEQEDIITGFHLGAVDYVTKPFNAVELLARVRTHLALKRSREQIEQKNSSLTLKNQQLEKLNDQLQHALEEIRTLRGILPICAGCKRIRQQGADPSKKESWVVLEQYIQTHTDAKFTHSMCPECIQKYYPNL